MLNTQKPIQKSKISWFRKPRKLTGNAKIGVSVIAVSMSIFHLYTGFTGIQGTYIQRSAHVGFAFVLIFLLYSSSAKYSQERISIVDVVLALVGALTMAYILINYHRLLFRFWWVDPVTKIDLVLGVLAIVLVLEVTRRTIGLPMVILAIILLAYNFLGPYFPKGLAHRGIPFERVVETMYLTTEGIFGVAITVSSTFIILFTIFGAMLNTTRATDYFMDVSQAIAGGSVGGPAKVAVMSSALMGTISGSSVANVATTGSITIPLMKKMKYEPSFAGAVECASSIGGQIMPPVMGAAAFLISGLTGIPYLNVCKHALIPACLYFLGIYVVVHFHSLRIGLRGSPKEELPKLGPTLLKGSLFLVPIAILVITLLRGYTPVRAALNAIISTMLITLIKKEGRSNFIRNFLLGLENGAITCLPIIAACACAGLIIGTTRLTGLGVKFGALVIGLAEGSLPLALFLSAVAGIFLGFGLPTTATYIVMASLVAPGLMGMGVAAISAHLFVFYYAIIACGTPPVAVAAYAAAGIARSNPIKTGFEAVRIQFVAYFAPFLFIYFPSLLLQGSIFDTINATVIAVVTFFFSAAVIEGYLLSRIYTLEKILLIISVIGIIWPSIISKVIGGSLLTIVILNQIKNYRSAV